MTPLAFRLAKEMLTPAKDRTFNDNAGLLARLGDIHCFELTAVTPLMDELAKHIRLGHIDDRTSFLPAPKTWIETRYQGGTRLAWFLEEAVDKSTARIVTSFSDDQTGQFGSAAQGEIRLGEREQGGFVDPIAPQAVHLILAALAIINTPRIIGRQSHAPHRGLERRLLSMRGVIGKFPLHAWTEIKLKVADIRDADDEPEEAHYTGERALHFCRAHLRVRLGRVEIVRSHWRGDASLGIKRSRYVMENART